MRGRIVWQRNDGTRWDGKVFGAPPLALVEICLCMVSLIA